MKIRDDVHQWLESFNPLLLFADHGERVALGNRKEIIIFPETEVLIVEGVDKYNYLSALSRDVKVLLVEKNLRKISSFLSDDTFVPSENLFLATDDKEQLLPILKKFVFKKVQFEGRISDVASYVDGMHLSYSEYRDLGETILPNIVSNLLHIDHYLDGRELIGLLEGEEAIVCGSGVSLQKGLAEIKSRKDRPFIISVGSSLPILIQEGIIPDFFVIIDQDPPISLYECLKDLSIPVFYQNRANKDVLFLHTGVKIFMGSSKGWQIEDALMREMGRENFAFDAGSHAGNFGAHIALSLGCKKVVLLGMDGISKEGEQANLQIKGKSTRADLFYGMEFFKTLQEEFPKQELLHYTEGFVFDESAHTEKLDIAPKKRHLSLPYEKYFDQDTSKRVIDGYFDNQMLSSLHSFFIKIKEESSMTKAYSACVLAELSMEPLFINFLFPLWDIWKNLIEESDHDLSQLTFYYKVLEKFSKRTGFEQDLFYLFGKREGEYSSVDKNSIPREEGYYFNGKQEKSVRQFNDKGELTIFQEMKEGCRHGKFRVYRDGYLQRDGPFYKGQADGMHRCYEKERVVDETHYRRGEKILTHKYYSDSGLKLEEIVHKDEGFFDKSEYNESGQLKYSAIWEKGVFHEKSFESGKLTMSRKGKIVSGKMVFSGEDL